MQKEELSNHSINDPTLLNRKENANDCMASTWQGTQEVFRAIPPIQQIRQRKGHQYESNEEDDYVVDPQTGWRFYKGSRGNLQTSASGSRANLQAASSSSSTWDQTHWKTSNWNSQHSLIQALTTGDFFLRVKTGFGCLERNLQPTDGSCEQYTHKCSTYRVAQHDHISSCELAWLKSWKGSGFAHLCLKKL